MKELINVMILIPLLALAWIGYQRVFPDGLDVTGNTPAATRQAQAGDATGEQRTATGKTETSETTGAASTEAGGATSEKDKDAGYTDEQLLAGVNHESMDELKSTAGSGASATGSGMESEEKVRDRLDQAISLMERLNKLGGTAR